MSSLAIKALTNYWAFLEHIQFKGGVKNFDPVHKELAYFLMAPQLKEDRLGAPPASYRKRAVFMHRSGLKSTLVVGYALWRIYRNPNIRILINCCDKGLAGAFLREIVQHLIDSDLQDRVWHDRPHIKGELVPIVPADKKIGRIYDKNMFASLIAQKTIWSQDKIQVIRPDKLKEPTISIASVKTTETGMHYDLIINDDLVNFENSDSDHKAKKIYTNVADLLSVLDPPRDVQVAPGFSESVGREIITTGTPYFDWDYNVTLINKHKELGYRMFWKNIYANGVDSSEGYTCPSRFNDDICEEIRKELIQARGAKAWAAQYLLKTIADENRAFTHTKIVELREECVRPEYNGTMQVKLSGDWEQIRMFSAVDPASSTNAKANHSALVIGGLSQRGDLVIVGGFKRKFTPTQLANESHKIWDDFGIRRAWVETAVGLGTNILELFKLLQPEGTFRVLEASIPRGDKNERITYTLEPWLGESTVNRVWVCSSLYKKVIQEIQTFDVSTDNNDDDLLDAIQIVASRLPKRKGRGAGNANQYRPPIDRKYGGFR